MKTVLTVASFLTLCIAGAAHSDEYHDNVLVLGDGYAAGPMAGFPVDAVLPNFGDWITIVGTITGVNEFFGDLLPPGPYELTYMFAGATCISYSDNPISPPCQPTAWGLFTGGTLQVFLDTTPDADFAHGDTFTDGELVLAAATVEHRIWNVDAAPGCWEAPDWESIFMFYAGSWYPRISSPPFVGTLDGEIDGNVPAGLAASGFTFHVSSGAIGLHYNVATRPTTWGYVKSLYR